MGISQVLKLIRQGCKPAPPAQPRNSSTGTNLLHLHLKTCCSLISWSSESLYKIPSVDPQAIRPEMSDPYQPINKSSRDIRLLNLHRGEWQDDIECELHVVSLDEKPKYEALSYTWGSGSSTKPIFVNSNEVRVTVNLEAALRHIRNANQSHTLWIDALCINQKDVAEKTHQVALMAEIYKGCTHCYAWLGCPGEYLERDRRSPDETVLKMCKYMIWGPLSLLPSVFHASWLIEYPLYSYR
jgi:hypothetical protein